MFGMEAREQDAGRVAVLDVGGGDEQVEEQAVLVNDVMPLMLVYMLVRVVPAPLTDWESTITRTGQGQRRRRSRSRRRSW
ncbi:hypothetical protein OG235_08195 [Streptomyces sp. NBC_00024]